MRKICQINDIENGQAKAFGHPTREQRTFFIVRQDDQVWAYLNMCPHMGVAMEFQDDKFMSYDGTQIQCAMHGALFNINTGFCSWGPCKNQSLIKIDIKVSNSTIYFIEDDVDGI